MASSTDAARKPRLESLGAAIEHILPQTWQENWPLAEGRDPAEAAIERERLLHTLGNLTLVNDRLNPALSNDAWEKKSLTLADHTVLHLNKQLLNSFSELEWTESTIRERGSALAELAKAVWPAPANL